MTLNEEPKYIVEERGKYKPRMKPNIPGKLFYVRTLLIGFAFFACSLAWSYYNFTMPLILSDYLIPMGVGDLIDFVKL